MKIETQPREDHQVKLIVEADEQQLEAAKQRAARQIARRTKIPGFRPGKAPYHMIERTVGEAAILEEAIDLLINDIYPQVIEESGIKPYGPGKLENVTSVEPPTFEFVVPLEAETKLGDFRAVRLDYELKAVGDEEVQRVIDNVREQQAIIEPVERPAQAGDMVQIKLSGERVNPEEGENPVLIPERTVPVVIETEDADAEMEWPFPGFSHNLIGMQPGDEKELTYTFPEDSNFEALRGKTSKYKVVLENVKSRTLPEANDEFAATVGDYDSVEALKTEIRQHLEDQSRSEYLEEYDEKIFEEVLKDAELKYPPQMLEDERQSVLRQLENRLSRQNLDLETYLKTRQMTREELLEELTPVAESRLKRFLVLFEIAKQDNIRVDPSEIQRETTNTINTLAQSMSPREARRTISQEVVSNLATHVTTDLLVEKTLERMRAIARGEGESTASDESSSSETAPEEPAAETMPASSVQVEEPAAEETAPAPPSNDEEESGEA